MQTHIRNWDEWVAKVRGILEGNQIQSKGYRYTRPAPHVYEYQWLWDSCFHAIAYRWFDPAMAQDELLSLIAHQVTEGADAGMIPHMAYWNGDGSPLWGQAERSIITQPPLIGVAANLVYDITQDQDFLRKIYAALSAYHDWFVRRRDPDGDHLVSMIHPWESGWDAPPRWDAPMGLDQPNDEQSKTARHGLVKQLIAQDCDAQAGYFHVEGLEYNAIRAADLEQLSLMAEILGDSEAAERWQSEAKAVQAAVMGKMGGYDLMGLDETPIRRRSAAPFILLFGGCISPEGAEELLTQLSGSGFTTPYPVPTTPADDPFFDPAHYWRGNVWLSVNWLIFRGLLRYGYNEQAEHLAERSLDLVAEHGFHEYFNPLTGEGYGPQQQSWSTIVLDMLAVYRA